LRNSTGFPSIVPRVPRVVRSAEWRTATVVPVRAVVEVLGVRERRRVSRTQLIEDTLGIVKVPDVRRRSSNRTLPPLHLGNGAAETGATFTTSPGRLTNWSRRRYVCHD
jgi:hypothetical protein